MQYISEIRAKGLDDDNKPVEWVVALYIDHQAAFKHHALCHAYLARAQAELPPTVRGRDRDEALRNLRPAHDPLYAEKKAIGVTYSLDAIEVSETAPVGDDQSPWGSVMFKDERLENLAYSMARRFMRDEEQDGAPEYPLPPQKVVEQALWTIGVNPSLPVIDCPRDTCGDLLFGRYADFVEERRRERRERAAAYWARHNPQA